MDIYIAPSLYPSLQNNNNNNSCSTAMGEGTRKGDRVNRISSECSFSSDSSSSLTSCLSDISDDASSPAPASRIFTMEADHDQSSHMQQLPNRKGLSKFYQGKSQSFQCLSDVRSVEDLPKKVIPFNRKMKMSRSCEGGFDGCSRPSPYGAMTKKSPTAVRSNDGFKPPVPAQKHAV